VADTAAVAPPVDSIYAWTVIDYRSFQPLTGTCDALIQNDGPELVSSDPTRSMPPRCNAARAPIGSSHSGS
jgi:hypothetical protein